MSPIKLIAVDEAQAKLADSVGLPPTAGLSAALSDQVIAESLRRTLCWFASRARPEQLEPVYVTSLTNHVREQLSPLWPSLHRSRNKRPSQVEQSQVEQQLEGDTQPDPIRRVLQALSDLREAEYVGEGYWLPTPVRFVELPNENVVLVVGGLDTATLRRTFHPRVTVLWITRMLERAMIPPAVCEDPTLWQTLSDYLGDPPASLSDWTKELVTRVSRSLKPSAAGYTRFEIYSPTAERNRLQYYRWIQADRLPKPPEGVVLCRAADGYQWGPRRYWLGTISEFRGERRAETESPIDPRDVLRLQYGLDLFDECPTRVLVGARGDDMLVQFENFLPPEERRLLLAFGREESERPGRLPTVYRFRRERFHLIQAAIEGLGLTVRTF